MYLPYRAPLRTLRQTVTVTSPRLARVNCKWRCCGIPFMARATNLDQILPLSRPGDFAH